MNRERRQEKKKVNEESFSKNLVICICAQSVYDAVAMVFVRKVYRSICCLTHIHIHICFAFNEWTIAPTHQTLTTKKILIPQTHIATTTAAKATENSKNMFDSDMYVK